MATGATPTNGSGGYEYQFVENPPDRLVCKICLFPSRDPYLSVCCGHNFCKSCLDGVKKAATTIQYVCPMCRSKDEFNTVPNKGADRDVRSLHVFCTNMDRGCKWQGEVNNLNNHLNNNNGCLFETGYCPYECGKVFERRYMAVHLQKECPRRKVNCQYCGIQGEYQFIEQTHIQECPKVSIACPNNCTVKGVRREDMEAHKKECPLEMVQCSYNFVGCEERMMRKDLMTHFQSYIGKHLDLTIRNARIQQQHINDLTETVSISRKELLTTKNELERQLEDTKSLAVDLNTRLGTQKQHLNILQGKLQEDVNGLTAYGNKLQKKVEDNIETELLSTQNELAITKQELATVKRELNNLKVAFASTEGRLQAKSQTEIKQLKTYVDEQYHQVKTDIDKDLSANKQKLNKLMQQSNDTKHELDELTKTTKWLPGASNTLEQRLTRLDDKLKAEIEDVKRRLAIEQQQVRNSTQQLQQEVTNSKHEIGLLRENARKMDERFN